MWVKYKIVFLFVALTYTAVVNGTLPAYFTHYNNDTKTDSFFCAKTITLSNEKNTVTIRINVEINLKNTQFFIVTECDGIKGCNENDILTFYMEDEEMQLTSGQEFNCRGVSVFTPDSRQIQSLMKNKIIKVRFQNGRSMDYYELALNEDESTYFMNACKAYQLAVN